MELKNMSYIEELIAGSLLNQRTRDRGFHIIDALIDPQNASVVADSETMQTSIKNVCAKVHVSLADRVDHVCSRLNMSKRSFLEAAMIQACDTFEAIYEELGMDDYYEQVALSVESAMEQQS
jgi:hypothetical protein